MKIAELRELNNDELKLRLAALKKELFDLRMQQTEGKLSQPHKVRLARREVAQVLTVLEQKGRPAAAGAKP